VDSSEDGFFQAKHVVNDLQSRGLSNPEIATKHLARTERPFFKHRGNCSRNIIHQEPSGLGIVRENRSPLVKESPPFLNYRHSERFWAISRLKLGVYRSGFHRFEHEEMNHRSLFQINPK
jgi:hypothetical protein